MNRTNIVCGVKACKYCSLSWCRKKVVMLDDKGNCLSKEIITGKDAADGAAQDAA